MIYFVHSPSHIPHFEAIDGTRAIDLPAPNLDPGLSQLPPLKREKKEREAGFEVDELPVAS